MERVDGVPLAGREWAVLGIADFDKHLDSIVTQVFESRKMSFESSESPEALKELQQLQKPIREMIFNVVREERARFRVRAGSNKEISLLEKRIEKLYGQLESLENALKMISTSKVQNNQQILNALRELGLLHEDKYFEKKREMLKIVLDTNKVIRKSAKELEAQGITLASPRKRAPTSLAS